ncbi:uncharacterized protein [Acropora muricata]|uniref:uncharacterized protein isoform X3 n=1 Tax=Acropora muricata TaxID=159855 RepID=UPI0034E4ADB0
MAKRGSSFQGTSGLSSQEATEDCTSLIPSRKLKVTLLGSEWGSTKAGLSTFNREFAIQLAKNENVEVSMYLPLFSEEDVRAAAGLGVCLLKAKNKPGYDPIDWLAWIPRDHCMDVVIGHGSHLGRQVSSIREFHPDCKWIQVVHTDPEELGMFKDYDDSTVKGEKNHQAEVELCELADQVVAVGPKLTEVFACYLRSCGKDQGVINLTPGIFSEFANINQASKGGETFRVLVFGRGDSEDFRVKGHDIAACAVAKLKDEEHSFKLVFVGAPNGEEEKVKERFLKEGILPSQLIVRRAKERKQLVKEFCQADLVIMPSRTEGFGLAALEALSAGLPVLVSGNSGIGKALKKVPYGSHSVVNLEFNDEDSKKWAEAIRAVCRKEREVRLEEATLLCQNYAKTYQWEGQCRTLVEKMCKMIKETSATVPDETVAAVNLGGQGSGSVSEAVFHPDLTTVRQQIVGDVVSSGREDDIQRKRPSHPIVTSNERQRQNASAGWGGTHDLLKTPTAPHQAVAANNLGYQGLSPETPETVQQHILDDVMTSGSEKGSQELRHGASGVQQPPLRKYGVQDNKPPQLSVKLKKARDVVASTTEWRDVHLPIDILLMTVDSCDFLSCYSLLGQPFRSYNDELGYVYFGRMGEASEEGKLWVALMTSSAGADTPGGSLTVGQIAFKVLQPKAVFSVGTCISLDPEKVRMGDVVISSNLTTAEGFRVPVSPRLSRLAKDAHYGWVPPLENPGELDVNVHPNGDILSLSPEVKRQYVDICNAYPGAVAIETKGKGVYAASHTTNIEWVIVKGVVSHFHRNHSATSGWNSFASTMAASVVAKLLIDPTVFREWRHYNQGTQGVRHRASEGEQLPWREYGELYVRLFIWGKNLEGKKKEAMEEILIQVVEKYVKCNEFSKDNIEEDLKSFTDHLVDVYGVHLVTVGMGSVIIILDCPTLDSLEHLWNDYLAGHLDNLAERYLVSNEMKKKLDLETVSLKTTILEEDYLNCKEALMELRSTYSETSTVQHQAVAANYVGSQGPSAIPETVQQHSLDAVVASCSGNGRQGVRQEGSGDQHLSLREYGETSTVQHQAVAANYLGSQGPSAIPETVQQHSLDAVVTSCSGNGRQGVRQEGSGDQHLSLREYGVIGGKKKELSQPSPDDKKPPQLSFKQKKNW